MATYIFHYCAASFCHDVAASELVHPRYKMVTLPIGGGLFEDKDSADQPIYYHLDCAIQDGRTQEVA